MGQRVFLTGISGYLGQTLAEHLALAPDVDCVTGISRSTPHKPLPAKVQHIRMDVRSPEVPAAMAGHDVVMHSASIVLWPARMPAAERDDIDFGGTRNVARAAVSAGIRTFVQASSTAVYFPGTPGQNAVTEDAPVNDGRTSFYYANDKATCERILAGILQPAGVCLSLLRPTWVLGRRNRSTIKGYRAGAMRFMDRDPRMQFVHEDDVAEAFLLAMRQDLAGPYNVVADDAIPWSQVLAMIGVRHPPAVPLWLARLMIGLQWRFLGGQTHPSWIETLRRDFVLSNARLKAAGWQPHYTSAEALRSAL